MTAKTLKIQDLVTTFDMEILSGQNGLSNEITTEEFHSPGLELTGFLKHFPKERTQILGKQEMGYINTLDEDTQNKRIEDIVKLNPPCLIITRGQQGNKYLDKYCNIYNVPLLRTSDKTTKFISKLSNYLEKCLAEEIQVHGVCLNVFGVGLLLTGDSGIGKSETALSLIQKGHRLISDDAVIIKRIGPNALIATHNGFTHDFLSLRGVGLVNVARLYGASAVQEETRIVLSIRLSFWEEGRTYNELESKDEFTNYLGVDVKTLTIPIRPGRDISSIIEVAINNYKLEQKGYNAFESLQERMLKAMQN
jgi:HPr kinase/phosphorylase